MLAVTDNLQNVDKFDRWSKSYNDDRMQKWFASGQAKTVDILSLREGDSLLDVGCGTGWAVTYAAGKLSKGKACGIDLSPGMIAQARKTAAEFSNVEFHVADAEAIPYPDGTFDAIVCTHSFHHYSNPVEALREMKRVLVRDGKLLIQDSDRSACLWVRLWDLFNRTFEKGHIKYYTRREALDLLRKAGFENVHVMDFEHRHLNKGKIGCATYVIMGQAGQVKLLLSDR